MEPLSQPVLSQQPQPTRRPRLGLAPRCALMDCKEQCFVSSNGKPFRSHCTTTLEQGLYSTPVHLHVCPPEDLSCQELRTGGHGARERRGAGDVQRDAHAAARQLPPPGEAAAGLPPPGHRGQRCASINAGLMIKTVPHKIVVRYQGGQMHCWRVWRAPCKHHLSRCPFSWKMGQDCVAGEHGQDPKAYICHRFI